MPTLKELAKEKEIEIPDVKQSDLILHSRDGREQNYRPAIVMSVNDDTIDVMDMFTRAVYPGVRFYLDPRLNEEQKDLFGCWKDGEALKRHVDFENRLKALEEQVAVLTGALSEPKSYKKQ